MLLQLLNALFQLVTALVSGSELVLAVAEKSSWVQPLNAFSIVLGLRNTSLPFAVVPQRTICTRSAALALLLNLRFSSLPSIKMG